MSYTYEQKKKRDIEKSGAEPSVSSGKESALPNSTMMNELGHRVDMPVVMREKMENSFGMDLSGVKLYENRAVGEAGAEAVAKGSNIAFAPGKLDFSSTRGQALLGHEISHVASQARGEVKGKGLVNDSALEARADAEGMKAAHGMSVTEGYGGATAPLSTASAASAAGPMQAKSGKKELREREKADMESANAYYSDKDEDQAFDDAMEKEKIQNEFRGILKPNYELIHYEEDEPTWGEQIKNWFKKIFHKPKKQLTDEEWIRNYYKKELKAKPKYDEDEISVYD